MDVCVPEGTIVADLPNDVSSPNGVPFLHFNASHMGVGDGDTLLLVFENNEARLSIPVHISRLVGTAWPGYPHDPAFKRGQYVFPPSVSVFVFHVSSPWPAGPANAISLPVGPGRCPLLAEEKSTY